MGNPLLRRAQVFPEATVGTAGEATFQLSGAFTPQNSPEQVRREEYRANLLGSNTYDFLSYQSEWGYRGRATTQELPFFLASSIRGDIAPTTPAGAVKLWTYAQPLTTIPALKSLCCYAGDNTQALRSAGMFTRRWTLEGQDTAVWMLTADMLGRETVTDSFADPALTTIANKSIRNKLTRVYINDAGADIGTTQKTISVLGFRFEYNSGIEPLHTMDGALDMQDITRGPPSATLTITGLWNATFVTEFGHWRTGTTRFVRVYNEGDTISTTYEHSVQIDGAYIYTAFEPLAEERNGIILARVTLTLIDDATWTKALDVIVQNTLTTTDLPTT